MYWHMSIYDSKKFFVLLDVLNVNKLYQNETGVIQTIFNDYGFPYNKYVKVANNSAFIMKELYLGN